MRAQDTSYREITTRVKPLEARRLSHLSGGPIRLNGGCSGNNAARVLAEFSPSDHEIGEMLVLSRKQIEEIVIGDNKFVIQVLDIRNGVARLRIKAPSDVPVDREEIRRLHTYSPRQLEAGRTSAPIFSRRKDEKIIIGDNISIKVVEIRGDKVRLGIEAPRDISVHRREVYDEIKRKQADQNPDGEGESQQS